MDKTMIHEELDEYWGSVLSNYSSQQRSENEIIATFELGGKKVISSVCYSENGETKELAYFSLDLKITDNIKDFFEVIGEPTYCKIVQELNIFYDLANATINGLSFTFSYDFELQSVMLIDESYDRSKRVFKTDVKNMLINENLNERDLIDLMIADYINSDDDLISDAIDLALPNYDDSEDDIIIFLEDFRKYNLKSLYIYKRESKKKAIEQFTTALTATGIDYSFEMRHDDNLLIKCNTRSFVYNFEVYCVFNDARDGFDITFKIQYQNFKNINPFNYLLQITRNEYLYTPFKQLMIKADELKKPIDAVTIHINPDLSFNRVYLNNSIIYSYHALKNTGNNEYVLWIYYLYNYHKDLIDSQNLVFLNESNLTETTDDFTNIVKDYQDNKENLMLLINMKTI